MLLRSPYIQAQVFEGSEIVLASMETGSGGSFPALVIFLVHLAFFKLRYVFLKTLTTIQLTRVMAGLTQTESEETNVFLPIEAN